MFTQVTALLIKEALAMPAPPAMPAKPAPAAPPAPVMPPKPPTGAQTMPSPTAAMPSL